MRPIRATVVMGTRPEVIKMAPVVRAIAADPAFRLRVCVTAQHRQMLDAMLSVFGIRPNADLNVMRDGQSLNGLLARVVEGMDTELRSHRPDLLLVQGDTTTVLGATLAACHLRIPVGHIEAGLRSFDPENPFPEEMNRIVVDRLSSLHFAPTRRAAETLRREGIGARKIFVTGNTSVDALLRAAALPEGFDDESLRRLPPEAPLALVTLHRRESFGSALRGVLRALALASEKRPNLLWVYPVHPNPQVQKAAAFLRGRPRFLLVEPLRYPDFVRLMRRSSFIVSDSGGVQEEAPSFATPVLVVRTATERTEFLGRGGVLVGTNPRRLKSAILRLPVVRRRDLSLHANPFGDGRAAERIRRAIRYWAGRGRCPSDFEG